MKFAKKSLGQNFLVDKNIVKKIIKRIEIKNKDIIEIGPGNGALTDEILKKKPKKLSIIEKDSLLFKKLKFKYRLEKNIKIFHADILNFDIEKINTKNCVIFGNLPYNISSQILVKILKFKNWPPKFTDIIFMFQKELGEKILGKFQSENYGRLSILTSYRLKFVDKFSVSSNCFNPKPKVTSLVIHFKPKIDRVQKIKDINNLEKVTNILFSNKRKMINKNIKKLISEDQIKNLPNINLNLRPADIHPNMYYKITEILEKK